MIHHFKVYKQDDNYVFEEVRPPYNENGTYEECEKYWEWVDGNGIRLVSEEEIANLICLEYNGDAELYSYLHTWNDVENEFEDPVVEALKKDEYYREIEFAEDPEDDDIVYEWQIFHPKVILLPE